MECVWPLSPILMLFGSATVVVLIKTTNTKLKGMEMEFENKSSGFFILLPALPLHLFFFYVCFLCCLFYSFSFPLFFLISHPLSFPSSPSLPSPTFASTTLPLILSFTFFSSCSSFTMTNPFLSLGLSFLTPQSRLTCYIFQLSVVGFCHASLCICPVRAPYSCSLTGSITNSENLFRNTHL